MITKKSKKDLKINFILLCVSLLISLFIGECLLRFLGYYGVRGAKVESLQLVEDPILDYRMIPNSSYISNNIRITINKHGWRDYDYKYEKPGNAFRIVVLGDSVTCTGVKTEELYPKRLEEQLNHNTNELDNLKFEVIMIALSGLNTEQEAHLFEIEGIRYDPDLLIIGYVLNDPESRSSLKKSRLALKNRSWLHTLKKGVEHSSLIHLIYRSAQKIYWKISVTIGKEQVADYIYEDYFSSLHKDPNKWAGVVSAFEKIDMLSEQYDIPVVLIIFPVLYKLQDYHWTDLHQQITDTALANNFMVLDLLPYYQQYKQSDLQKDNGDHIHPNAFGHQVASAALYEFLLHNDLLPLKSL